MFWPNNDTLPFFKFLQKKVDKKGSCTFFYNFWGCNLQKVKWQDLSWKPFSVEIGKMLECHFWADVMSRQSCLWASKVCTILV